jgi:hypothetical protein
VRITFVPDAGVRAALGKLARELEAEAGRAVTLSAALRETLARGLGGAGRDAGWASGWREGFRAGYAEAKAREGAAEVPEGGSGPRKHN